MKLLYCFCFLFLSFAGNGQNLLKGVVMDAEKNSPLPNASVFLNATSVGTSTDEKGNFSLSIPTGRHELVVSCVGYATYSQTITTSELSHIITIKLNIKSAVLKEVIVEPYEKDGWEKWGRFFVENFIGISANALECKIKNQQVIHFRNSKKNSELTAVADEPLIIENKALGYRIYYQLETFKYDFKNHYLLYTGFPFFQPMKGSTAKQKLWERKRSEAYYGSLMHFMRSVYRNSITEEGFEVRPLQKVLNTAEQKQLNKDNLRASFPDSQNTVAKINSDANIYYDQLSRPDDYKDLIGIPLTGDSIAYAKNLTTACLDFGNYLLVIYKNKPAPPEYELLSRNGTSMMSQIVLINGRPIEIQANGSYYDPADLMSTGYWAWSEKISMMLPFDYKPAPFR